MKRTPQIALKSNTRQGKAKKLKPMSAEHFERERAALVRLFNQGVLTASEHKDKDDYLVKRLKAVE